MNWFRHWHGLSTNPKLAFVAKCCDVHRAFVVTLWCYLLEGASGCGDRGSLAWFDPDQAAFALEMPLSTVERIVAEMRKRGMLDEDRIAGWNRHQFPSDSSAERVRRHRERRREANETLQPVTGNVPVTGRSEQNRADQNRKTRSSNDDLARKRAKPELPGVHEVLAAVPASGGQGEGTAGVRGGDPEGRRRAHHCKVWPRRCGAGTRTAPRRPSSRTRPPG